MLTDDPSLTLYPAAAPLGTALVLAHGAGAGQHHPFLVQTADRLAARGIDVATFDFPYMTRGARLPDRAPVLEAAFERALAAARAHPSLTGRAVCIGGKSMGGRIATHLAARGIPIAAVVALGYPLHPPGRAERRRDAHLPLIEAPLLVVQGERDAFGTPSELAPVLALMRAPVTCHVIAGGDHGFAVRGRPPAAVLDEIADVTATWLVRTARPPGS